MEIECVDHAIPRAFERSRGEREGLKIGQEILVIALALGEDQVPSAESNHLRLHRHQEDQNNFPLLPS